MMTEATDTMKAGEVPDAPRPVVDPTERIASLDFIRGLAVMGILAANIIAFGQPFAAYMYPQSFLVPTGDSEGWQWIAQFVLIDGKMRGLFTLLFGAGMYLFMERAWARGSSRLLQLRRLLFLLVFGLIHFFLIWRGDILTYYALCGLVALPCLRWAARTQLIVGLMGYLAGAILYAAMLVPLAFVADGPATDNPAAVEMRSGLEEAKQDALADDRVETRLKTSGDYTAFVQHKLTEHWSDPLSNVLLFGLETLPLILIGMGLYRFGFFGGGIPTRKLRNWGLAGIAVGGLLTLAIALWARAGGFSYYGTLAAFMGMSPLPRLIMVLGLAALLVHLVPAQGGWLASRVSAAGRAAFTNYLGTSILMLVVFHGWGLGLFGLLNRPQLYVVTALVWVLILLWSKPWLATFRYGPLEWLWRCLTYGKLFRLKK